METSLNCIPTGKWVMVTELSMDSALKARLKDFGLIPGTPVCRQYCGPGGKVSALAFRGTVVALRTRELQNIQVRR